MADGAPLDEASPPAPLLVIDGSLGEGGGQVLRTSLSLAAIFGRAVRIVRIRGGRPKPGLQKQHMVCVTAAGALCAARVTGNALNSTELLFEPTRSVRDAGGDYAFDIGSAGSTTLVLQTLLPILLFAGAPARVRIAGGTHNPLAPPFEFLAGSFCPALARAGIAVSVELERAGFYPAGGGAIRAAVQPLAAAPAPPPLEMLSRGKAVGRTAVSASGSGVSTDAARAQLDALRRSLAWGGGSGGDMVVSERVPSAGGGKGSFAYATLSFERVMAVFTSVSDRGKSGVALADEVARGVATYAAGEAPVDEFLADQLLLPLALAGGGRFRALAASLHLTTNADIINRFLGAGTVAVEAVAMSGGGDGSGGASGSSGCGGSGCSSLRPLREEVLVTVVGRFAVASSAAAALAGVVPVTVGAVMARSGVLGAT